MRCTQLVSYLTEQNKLHVIDLNLKRELYKIDFPKKIEKELHKNHLRIARLNDGQDVVIYKEKPTNLLKIIDLETGLAIYDFSKTTTIKEFKLVTLQTGKEVLIISGEDKNVYILDLNNRSALKKLEDLEYPGVFYWSLVTTRLDDGREVAVFLKRDSSFYTVDLDTGEEVFQHTFTDKMMSNHHIGRLQSDETVAAVNVGDKIKIIDLNTGKEVIQLSHAQLNQVQLKQDTPRIEALTLLKDGRLIAASKENSNEIIFIDIFQNQELFRLQLPEEHRGIYGFTQSPAGDPILILHGHLVPFLYVQLYSSLEEAQEQIHSSRKEDFKN